MGFLQAYSECLMCRRPFFYNPERVPSLRVDARGVYSPTGTREPICANCMDRINALRTAHGLEPLRIWPGAYDAEEVL